MCHGQIVNEKILRARRARKCKACGKELPRGRRYHFITTMGYEDGLLGNASECLTCAAVADSSLVRAACFASPQATLRAVAQAVRARGWRAALKELRETRRRIIARTARKTFA